MINVTGAIFSLEETQQKVCKNSKMLQIGKVVLKIAPTVYHNIFWQQFVKNLRRKGVPNNKCLCTRRILKTTETTEITAYGNVTII